MKNDQYKFLRGLKPVLKSAADYCISKLAHAIISVAIGLVVVWYQHHAGKNLKAELHSDTGYLGTNWVGQSMSDAHNEIYANVDAIAALSNKVAQLERSK